MEIRDLAELLGGDIGSLSGLVLFRVTVNWANKGRTGKDISDVIARHAVEAIQKAWCELEDERDIRTVFVEWLSPIECIIS